MRAFERTVIWGTISWSGMGKQNILAENVYYQETT